MRNNLECPSESIAHIEILTYTADNADDALAIDPAHATSIAPAKAYYGIGEILLPGD
jgi:hypothetical protein